MYLPFEPFRSFKQSRDKSKEFCRKIYHHLWKLEKDGLLAVNGFGKALLNFSMQEGITEENALAEIFIIFVAGKQ